MVMTAFSSLDALGGITCVSSSLDGTYVRKTVYWPGGAPSWVRL